MARRRPRDIGTDHEVKCRDHCLRRIWKRMLRSSTVARYGDLADFFDQDELSPFAFEAKAGEQQRFEDWWAQASKAAGRMGNLIPVVLWRRRGKPASKTSPYFPPQPRNPWVVMDWKAFEPIALFLSQRPGDFRRLLAEYRAGEFDEYLEHRPTVDPAGPSE